MLSPASLSIMAGQINSESKCTCGEPGSIDGRVDQWVECPVGTCIGKVLGWNSGLAAAFFPFPVTFGTVQLWEVADQQVDPRVKPGFKGVELKKEIE